MENKGSITLFVSKPSAPNKFHTGEQFKFHIRVITNKSKGRDVPAPHLAAFFLDETLAKQIASFYHDKNRQIVQESGYLAESDTVHASLESVGEAVYAQELESTVRAALRVLKKTEVQAVLDKVLQESA